MQSFDIACFTETYLSVLDTIASNDLNTICGFNIFQKYHKKHGGGVMIATKRDLSVLQIHLGSIILEIVSVTVYVNF